MQDRMRRLESKIAELLEKVNKDTYIQWLSHPCTKAVLIQLELDQEEIKDNWANNRYTEGDNEAQAKGQVAYILGLDVTIRSMKEDENESED